MPFPPSKKSMEGLLDDTLIRLNLVERRIAIGGTGGAGGGGSGNLAPGLIMPYGGTTPPTGWLFCNGNAVSRTNFPALFATIGTAYGAGDGSTTFNLPNLKGRVPVGQDAAQAEFDVIGEKGGEKTHTLTIAEMPSHSHTWMKGNDNNLGASYGWQSVDDGSGALPTNPTGGGGAHNNLQPYIVTTYIISTGIGGGAAGTPGAPGAPGAKGTPGSLWYDSNPAHWDPVNVPSPRVGDQFLYPISGDVFTYQGPNNDWAGWLYIGSIAGPQGPPGSVYWENVEDHGAVGNGTTDDTAAIQAAINTGRPVYIPPKTFAITAALTVHSGTRIFGDRSSSFGGDTQSTIKQITPGAHGLHGTDVVELQVEDVLLLGPTTGLGDGIRLDRNVNPATLYVNLSRVYVQNFGQDGVSISNAIVSTFDRVVCERNGRHGFNLHGVYKGAAGTSMALNGCFANNNGVTGYTIDSMVYMGLNGCAAEHQAIDYDIISCQGISFTGCGSEQNQGISWKIHDGSLGIGLYSCWSYRSKTISVLVTNNSRAIVIAGFVENTPEPGATNSLLVEDGCRATVMTGNFIAPIYYAPGTTVVLDDGGGALKTYGDVSGGYFAAQYGGDFGGYRVTSVAAPVDPTDAVNKAYVDAAVTAAIQALTQP